MNLDITINSGQVFLWKKYDDTWYGINGQNVLKCNSRCTNQGDFFRESDDITKIKRSISRDDTIKKAVKRYSGLKLLRQDPFQCCISFIASSNSNIQKIRMTLEKLCIRFGDTVKLDGMEFHLFPKPHILADADINDLLKCKLGYRAKYIKKAAKMVPDFEDIKNMEYEKARDRLKEVPGVGNKVADCILLFSLDKLEAFPIDTWVTRILQKYYPKIFDVGNTITDKQYQIIHDKVVEYFGPYAGYAQQFLFKMERDNNAKRW